MDGLNLSVYPWSCEMVMRNQWNCSLINPSCLREHSEVAQVARFRSHTSSHCLTVNNKYIFDGTRDPLGRSIVLPWLSKDSLVVAVSWASTGIINGLVHGGSGPGAYLPIPLFYLYPPSPVRAGAPGQFPERDIQISWFVTKYSFNKEYILEGRENVNSDMHELLPATFLFLYTPY